MEDHSRRHQRVLALATLTKLPLAGHGRDPTCNLIGRRGRADAQRLGLRQLTGRQMRAHFSICPSGRRPLTMWTAESGSRRPSATPTGGRIAVRLAVRCAPHASQMRAHFTRRTGGCSAVGATAPDSPGARCAIPNPTVAPGRRGARRCSWPRQVRSRSSRFAPRPGAFNLNPAQSKFIRLFFLPRRVE
jgi:hypothetical protein